MNRSDAFLRRLCPALLALACWADTATVVRRNLIFAHGDPVQTLSLLAAYLSHWTILFTTIVFSAFAAFPAAPRNWWWSGQCLIMNVAMSVGFWGVSSLKSFLVDPADLQFAHGVLPLLVAAYWLLLTERGRVRARDALAWLVLPLSYTGWMECYGFLTGFYPYPELDPFAQGRLKVLISIGEIFLVTALAAGVAYGIDRLGRPARPDRH